MNDYTATAIAIALVVGLGGLSAVPTALAVPSDCDEEFQIPDSEPSDPRSLLGGFEETGREEVTASGGDEEVTVRLDSDNDELEFGVFVLDNQTCVKASDKGLSTCTASETIDTSGSTAPKETTCQIDAPASGTLEYFFHMENQEIDSLDFSIWRSS